jgi:Divergent InlB B-repeat domain
MEIKDTSAGLFFTLLVSISAITITLIYNTYIDPFSEARGSRATNSSSYVTIEISPTNSGDIYCNGQKVSNMNKVYGIGTELTCKAVPKNNFTFNSWVGLSFNTTNPVTLKILHNGTLTANFSENPLIYTARVLSHPLVLLLIGAAITSYVIPLLTRRWQEHQKELELKVDLVTQISDSVYRIMIATEQLESESDMRSGFSDKEGMSNYRKASLDWQLKTGVIKAQIQLYFPKSDFKNKLEIFFEIVHNIYLLALIDNKIDRNRSFKIIKDNIIRLAKTPVTIQALDNIDWAVLAAKYSSSNNKEIHPDYLKNWLNLKATMLGLQSELLDEIVKLNISGFSNVRWVKLRTLRKYFKPHV